MTTRSVVLVASATAAVGAGTLGGLLFAFSTAVMGALGRRPVPEGIAAMQAVNVTILNPAFLVVFGGTTVLCLGLAVSAPFVGAPGAGWRVAGAVLLLVGCLGVTAVVNVPMNDALAAVDPATPEAATLWADYLTRWTAWNHVRTAAAIGSCVLLGISARG